MQNIPIFEASNFTIRIFDIYVIFACVLLSAIGGIAEELVRRLRLEESETRRTEEKRLFLLKGLIGAILGLVIGLYFFDMAQGGLTQVARTLAIAILLGYQAPNIWVFQQKALNSVMEKRIKDLEKSFDKKMKELK